MEAFNNYFFEIAFLGTEFHGWQRQENAITVQEVVEEKLGLILGRKIETVGCGRTDTGVHAGQFFFHCLLPDSQTLTVKKMNSILPRSISVQNIFLVAKEAHARFDASARTYEYHIHTKKDPFRELTSLEYNYPLSLELMNKACEILKQHENFASFCKSNHNHNSYLCKLFFAEWEERGKSTLVFTIKANRFLRNMVRSIVGTMLDVGRNKISLQDFEQILKSQDRCKAGVSVAAKGLFLTKVEYPYPLISEA